MRFSTIIAAASTLVLLGTVSAQTQPQVPNAQAMAACATCLNEAMGLATPACKGIEGVKVTTNSNSNSKSSPTEKELACFCSIAGKKDWGNSCAQPDKCSAEIVSTLYKSMELAAAQPGTCDKVSTTSAANMLSCSSSKMALGAAGAAMAIAGALF
ncbi:hypothetical protein BGZ95_001423 [Linnemannia exigua]|uniref:Uncharacterized protein n=1 Tax=Linnemannia exigua TaxID=604196 RepID=A0AAD4D6V6_9FUNG|nr:hypothetical protein BGZ95_001423 [Linnemannia exigua]